MAELAIGGISLIWDMLVGLIRGYETGKKDLFLSHIEPLHDRMLKIHKDYVKGFEEAKHLLEKQDTPTEEILRFLEERRRAYGAERDLAQKLSEELSKAERRIVRDTVWASVRTYCTSIQNYFSSTSQIGGISWYSDFLGSVRSKMRIGVRGSSVWTDSSITGSPRVDLLKEIDSILDRRLPNALIAVNTYYAVLRRDLL